MDISMHIFNSRWVNVISIPHASQLQKGRHGQYHDIVKAAGQISNRFGCYAWGTSDTLYYIGSFSKDYKNGKQKSNFHGQIHNYLQNHRIRENGRRNTNVMVFENLNNLLLTNEVSIFMFRFEYLELGQERVDFAAYCEDGELVRAVEQLLICSYRRNKQCAWNRE